MADLIIRFLKLDWLATVGLIVAGPIVVGAIFISHYFYMRWLYEPPDLPGYDVAEPTDEEV